MKILQIAPLTKPLPPEGYGGTERVVHWLASSLVDLGQDVYVATLPGGTSPTKYKKIFLPLKPAMNQLEKQNYVKACEFLAKNLPEGLEIIHGHSAGNIFKTKCIGNGACEMRKYTSLPILITIHGLKERLPETNNTYLAYISCAQMSSYPLKGKVIYNPINISEYDFCEHKENFLLWMAKLDWKEKGLEVALRVAEASKMELYVAGPGLNRSIEKKIKGKVKYLGEISGSKKKEVLAKAKGFLHTATWAEPFGITPVEALVSGTPVLAFNLGAMPEIIKDKETGFLCKDESEMIEKVKLLDTLSPQSCREWAIENFSAHKIAKKYLEYYKEIAANHAS